MSEEKAASVASEPGELGCDDEGCPNRPENRTSDVVKAVAEEAGR